MILTFLKRRAIVDLFVECPSIWIFPFLYNWIQDVHFWQEYPVGTVVSFACASR